MYATFVAADLDSKARCKLACGRVLVGKYAPAASAIFVVISWSSVFYVFFFISFYLPLGFLSPFIYHSHARARLRTLSIYTRSQHAAGTKQPSGYTLRLRLYTRSTAYAAANANNGHTASPIGNGSPGPSGSSSSAVLSPPPTSLRTFPGCIFAGE